MVMSIIAGAVAGQVCMEGIGAGINAEYCDYWDCYVVVSWLIDAPDG